MRARSAAIVVAFAAVLFARPASGGAATVALPYVPVAGPAVFGGQIAWVEDAGSRNGPALGVRVQGQPSQVLTPADVSPSGLAPGYGDAVLQAGVALGAGGVAVQAALIG